METLSQVPHILNNINSARSNTIRAFHVLCFGNEGDINNRKRLRTFSGFAFAENSDEFNEKVKSVSGKLSLRELIAISLLLGLDIPEGPKEEVLRLICLRLTDLNTLISESEDEEPQEDDDEDNKDEDDKEDENTKDGDIEDENTEEEDEENEYEDDERRQQRRPKNFRTCQLESSTRFMMTFRDVEETIRPFEGKEDYPIEKWINEFEETALMFEWSQIQKLIFGRKLLRGFAKLYVQSETNITRWERLKTVLREEFAVKTNSAEIHKRLSQRRMKKEETIEEYFIAMKELASRGSLEHEALFQYVIEGIDDEPGHKTVLYGARSIREFKEKLDVYKQLRAQIQRSNSKLRTHVGNKKREVKNAEEELRCFNCGDKGHKANDCKSKNLGRKCFKCNKFGHKASECQTKKEVTPDTSVKPKGVKRIKAKKEDNEYYKEVKIDGKIIRAFIDLGSDVVTMKQQTAEECKITFLPCELVLKGFGQGRCEAMGRRNLVLEIEGIKLEVEVLLVPDEAQEDEIIIGRSALDQPGLRVIKEEQKLTIEKVSKVEEGHNQIDVEAIKTDPELDQTSRGNLHNLVSRFHVAFSTNLKDLGSTDLVQMEIDVTSKDIVRYRPYRLPYAERETVRTMVEELLDAGIIRESTSEFSSPVILVAKKDGTKRLCIDYRRLNAITRKEHAAMPIIDEQLDKLSGNKYFTTLDFMSGYYQIPISEGSKHFTSFVTTEGQYEFNKMPFGHVNAPSVFSRLMNIIVKRIGQDVVLTYMDDMLIPSKTIEEGLEKLEKVLSVLWELGLTLKLSKCNFLCRRLNYLGYEIDENGVRPGECKTNAVVNFPRPTNPREIRQFLGLCGFFRRFVPRFSLTAAPLTDLTKQGKEFIWGEAQEHAFESLKKALSQKPILAFYESGAELQVHTDACKTGLAGILFTRSSSKERWKPLAYFSRKTTELEAKYHSYELEALAVVGTLERFRTYLLGRHFQVITDCNSLRTIMTKKDMSPRVARWLLKLQEFDFEVIHRSESQMKHIDALSRNPTEEARDAEEADLKIYQIRIDESDWLLTMQLQDKELQNICEVLKKKPTNNSEKQIHHDYKIENNRICRKTKDGLRWVVPKGIIWRVIHENHDNMGHYGVEKTLKSLHRSYWFPKMRKRVKNYVASCIRCAYHKVEKGKPESELHVIERQPIPFHTVNMDHLGPFVNSSSRHDHVLLYQDNFTKYTILRAVKTTKTRPVINHLKDIFCHFGTPCRLITDRGTAFTSRDFERFCEENQIIHIKNATATPRANGQAERQNQTLLTALTTTYNQADGKDWDSHLKNIQFALNDLPNQTTKKTPHELLFGYHPRNALQNQLALALSEETIPNGNIEKIREDTVRRINEQSLRNKERFDKKHKKPKKYEEGDLVLVHREAAATGQSRKLLPRYKGPYMISKVLDNDRYLLTDIPGAERTHRSFNSVFSTDRMKPWCQPMVSDDSSDEESDDQASTEATARTPSLVARPNVRDGPVCGPALLPSETRRKETDSGSNGGSLG